MTDIAVPTAGRAQLKWAQDVTNAVNGATNAVAFGNSKGISNAFGTTTTTSSTYGTLAAVSSFSWTKRFTATRVEAFIAADWYVTAEAQASFALLINGTDYEVFQADLNATNVYFPSSGFAEIAGGLIPAGVHTVQVRWKRVSGSGTVTSGKWLSARVREIDA